MDGFAIIEGFVDFDLIYTEFRRRRPSIPIISVHELSVPFIEVVSQCHSSVATQPKSAKAVGVGFRTARKTLTILVEIAVNG